MTLYLAMSRELLIARRHNQKWQVNAQLAGLQVTCLAVDPFHPERIYCGTYRRGLWRSEDAGQTWLPIGDIYARSEKQGIEQVDISAVAVSPIGQSNGYGVVYTGTEMSYLYRSDDGGESWQELAGMHELPSSSTWSFPPRPSTHHVRWITPDPHVAGRVYVAIEAGALIHTEDGGETWIDRVPTGPIDSHTLLIHPEIPDRLYSAAGDGFIWRTGKGYQESLDGGKTWQYPDEGLQPPSLYLYGMAVDPTDPDTILVSASPSPQAAHNPLKAESFVYRKTRGQPWQIITNGLPEAKGGIIAAFGTTAAEPGVFYQLSNRGCYRSPDAGSDWELLDLPWHEQLLSQHPQAIAITQE